MVEAQTITSQPKYPYHLVWISTNSCNARCHHCSSNSSLRTEDELSSEELFNLLDDLVGVGILDFGVSGGEPLLRPDIFEILSYAVRVGMSVGLGSNGSSLTEAQAAKLAATGVNRLQISLDGLRDAHDTLRNWPGLFDRVLSSIRVAQHAGVRVHVCCTINALNYSTLEAYVDFVAELGVKRINFSRFVPTGRGSHRLDLVSDEWRNVIERVAELQKRYKNNLEIVTHLAQQVLVEPSLSNQTCFAGCQAGIQQACITANGTVLPCVLLPVELGNIRSRPFAEIWRTSPIVASLQRREELAGACGACDFKWKCGGCRAVAYAVTGDYLQTDPRCWIANANKEATKPNC